MYEAVPESMANETVDDLDASTEALRHAAEDTPTGLAPGMSRKHPVFARENLISRTESALVHWPMLGGWLRSPPSELTMALTSARSASRTASTASLRAWSAFT
jgi:hypothetical protein